MKSAENRKAEAFEKTPLLTAIENGDSKLVQRLIRDGADVDLGDGNGVTPTHLAAYYCNTEILPLLIADSRIHGPRLTREDNNNKSALDYVFLKSIPNYKESPEKCDPDYKPKPTPKIEFGAVDFHPTFIQKFKGSLNTCLRCGGREGILKALELKRMVFDETERLEGNLIKPEFLIGITIVKEEFAPIASAFHEDSDVGEDKSGSNPATTITRGTESLFELLKKHEWTQTFF